MVIKDMFIEFNGNESLKISRHLARLKSELPPLFKDSRPRRLKDKVTPLASGNLRFKFNNESIPATPLGPQLGIKLDSESKKLAITKKRRINRFSKRSWDSADNNFELSKAYQILYSKHQALKQKLKNQKDKPEVKVHESFEPNITFKAEGSKFFSPKKSFPRNVFSVPRRLSAPNIY